MPLAFFCTLFFRHRKKSVSTPRDGKSQSAPESARQAPLGGNPLRPSYLLSCKQGGFPRGKQSARFALPCVPLVVCLNSGSLTAFGGCIHWIPASLRSPQPLRIATRSNRAPNGAASPAPAPESARQSPSKGNCLRQRCHLSLQAGWLSARPPAPPSGSRRINGAGICDCGRTGGFPQAKQSAHTPAGAGAERASPQRAPPPPGPFSPGNIPRPVLHVHFP